MTAGPLAAYKDLCLDAGDLGLIRRRTAGRRRASPARGGDIGWHVLAGPEGNEFCAFTP
jgi:hypothetical protein